MAFILINYAWMKGFTQFLQIYIYIFTSSYIYMLQLHCCIMKWISKLYIIGIFKSSIIVILGYNIVRLNIHTMLNNYGVPIFSCFFTLNKYGKVIFISCIQFLQISITYINVGTPYGLPCGPDISLIFIC